MSALVFGLWLFNILVDSLGQLAFKAAASHSAATAGLAHWRHMAARPWLWLGIGCYGLEFIAWVAFLSLVPLSQGVLLGSINIVVLMLAGRWLFHERLTPLRVIGALLVSAGVAVVGFGT